nr:DarT ssDNA thymidine ADP-ribosyltransferase family protein [Sulfitobacter algicola]
MTKFIERIRAGHVLKSLYHFTDRQNLTSINQHGILSKNEMKRRGFWPVKPSGNQWSWDADDIKGISDYVSICMTRDHPMCHTAVVEQRISDPCDICIDPIVLNQEGVLFCFDIANKTGVSLQALTDILPQIDTAVLYDRTDWKNAEIQDRLKKVKKYEILIPNAVPTNIIQRVIDK